MFLKILKSMFRTLILTIKVSWEYETTFYQQTNFSSWTTNLVMRMKANALTAVRNIRFEANNKLTILNIGFLFVRFECFERLDFNKFKRDEENPRDSNNTMNILSKRT